MAACGGGGGGGQPGANGFEPPTPSPCPAGFTGTAPNCSQQQAAGEFTPITSPTTIPLPAIAGYSGTVNVPAATVPGPVQITTSAQNPGVPVLTMRGRHTFTSVHVFSSQTDTPLLYITFTATKGAVTFTGFPSLVINLPSSDGSGPFYLAELEGGIWTTVAGPETPRGGSITLHPNQPVLSIPANTSIYFLLYTGGVVPVTAPTSSPGGGPTSSPSTNPTPTSSSSPSSSATPGVTPSTSPTLAPTPTPTTSATPTSFPTASPTATPTVAPNGSPPATFVMGTYPSGQAGTAISNNPISGFQVLDTHGNRITGSFSRSVTVSSNNSAVTLSILGGSSGSSVTLTSGSQTIALSYSGAATSAATITASATGATSNAATFTPLIQPVVYSGPTLSGSPEIDLYAPTGTGSTFTFTATQAGYTGSFGNSISVSGASGCSSFATIAPGSNSSFTVTTASSPAAGKCTIALNGFSSSIPVVITYSTTGIGFQ